MTSRIELARVDLRGRTPTAAELRAALPRGGVDVDSVLHQVRPVVEAIRDRGVGPHWNSARSSTASRPPRSGFRPPRWSAR